MVRDFFSDFHKATDDVVLVTDGINAEIAVDAYSRGIFPWPVSEDLYFWHCPLQRAILRYHNLHLSRRNQALWRQTDFRFTFNQAFTEVVDGCRYAYRPQQGNSDTWITQDLVMLWHEFKRANRASTLEVWSGNRLVAGIFLVHFSYWSGESMFTRCNNGSKFGLVYLMHYLFEEMGIEFLDVQMMTPHVKSLGAELVSKRRFLSMFDCFSKS